MLPSEVPEGLTVFTLGSSGDLRSYWNEKNIETAKQHPTMQETMYWAECAGSIYAGVLSAIPHTAVFSQCTDSACRGLKLTKIGERLY